MNGTSVCHYHILQYKTIKALYFFLQSIYPLFTLQLNGTNENTMLVCSATGEYPPITNISLLKNGDMITSAASESTLQVNTADLPPNINCYGLYVCVVDLSGFPLQQSVVLERRGKNIIVNIECRSKY